jgi:GTP cyclohydrolase I
MSTDANHYSDLFNGNGHDKHRDVLETAVVVRGSSLLDAAEVSYVQPYPETEILTGDTEQYNKVKAAIRDLLDAFNVNWDDPNYTKTPDRVARAYLDYWASGYSRNPQSEITTFPNLSQNDDLVLVKDMKFYSLCSHHLAPIEGYAAIAYVPDRELLGLSKLGRILEIYTRRFQLQERIGAQTVDAIMNLIKPKGVMAVLYNVKHGCMSSRGIKMHEAVTTTSAIRGIFRDVPALRAEVMSLLTS